MAQQGFDIRILGATVFDVAEGAEIFGGTWDKIREHQGKRVQIKDGPLTHDLLVTGSTQRGELLAREEFAWYQSYREAIRTFKPDIVYYYGGLPFDFLIADEARHAGAKVAFYLGNGNYRAARWHRDIDLIMTDTQATAELYAGRLGINVKPVGKFIDRRMVVASEHDRRHVLFVNPSYAKGGALVARLAILMEKRRPDIIFEVVQSRGGWDEVKDHAFRSHGEERRGLGNVIVTPLSADMRPIYGRARLLLVPSLWWESGGRVIVEALMNGIPAMITNKGGAPEVQSGAGPQICLHESLYEPPYTRLPADEALLALVEEIERIFDDENAYQAMSRQALHVAEVKHNLQRNAENLAATLRALVG
ncbi:glycosyltransferase [Parasphingorhabdus sp.]|uniref:glycosyltransferase n=1 Tax=Parasphingorhabdus sp. TaxID=2709688 RepID=UPI003002D178